MDWDGLSKQRLESPALSICNQALYKEDQRGLIRGLEDKFEADGKGGGGNLGHSHEVLVPS